MIKPNEIRIGNLYHRKHGKGWTVTLFTEEIISKIFSNDKEFALNDFEPIVLSKDWIMNLGAREHIGECYLSLTNIKSELHFRFFQHTDEVLTTLKSDFSNLILDRIRYVHQLQNLYMALTNNSLDERKESYLI